MKALATLLLIVPALAAAQEESIAISKLPAPIRSAVTARFADAKITGAAKEVADGKTFFEVSLKRNGRNIDVTAMPSGELTLIKSEMAQKDLPPALTKLLGEKYPKATYRLVEEVRTIANKTETLSYYEVLLVDAKKQTLEVQVAVDGSNVLKEERKKPGEPNE